MTRKNVKMVAPPLSATIKTEFWQTVIAGLNHPVVTKAKASLDPEGVLGCSLGAKGMSWTGDPAKETMFDQLAKFATAHPDTVLAVQIGSFYEFFGVHAALAIEYCGLNSMQKFSPADPFSSFFKAGVPLESIQATLDKLTDLGFRVGVIEQADGGGAKKRKLRYLSQIVSAESPVYTHRLSLSENLYSDSNARPIFAFYKNERGYSLFEFFIDRGQVNLQAGLSEEACLATFFAAAKTSSEVYFNPAALGELGRSIRRAGGCERASMATRFISSSDGSVENFLKEVGSLVKTSLGLGEHVRFDFSNFCSPTDVDASGQPSPLYFHTASQLGLLAVKNGAAALENYCLPPATPVSIKELFKRLILCAPPHRVSDSVGRAVGGFLTDTRAQQSLKILNAGIYLKTLRGGQSSAALLRELADVCQNFVALMNSGFGKEFAPSVGELASYFSGVTKDCPSLARECKALNSLIASAVEPERLELAADKNESDSSEAGRLSFLLDSLFAHCEQSFSGRLKPSYSVALGKCFSALDKARLCYRKTVEKELAVHVSLNNVGKNQGPSLAADSKTTGGVFLKYKNPPKVPGFLTAKDSKGKTLSGRIQTEACLTSFAAYLAAAEAAEAAVVEHLKVLSQKISVKYSATVIQLLQFSATYNMLKLHAASSLKKGWSQNFSAEQDDTASVEICGVFPWWMSSGDAVKNDVRVAGTSILTGANLAGKSTILRSIAATTILASHGLCFPADSVRSPRFKSIFLKTGLSDSPLSGESHFSQEVLELKTVLDFISQNASAPILVLLDEFSSSTEVSSGLGLCAAVLEEFSRHRGLKSIFSTHLHRLWELPLDFSCFGRLRMETDVNLDPTYRLSGGTSYSSMAFTVAKKIGLPPLLLRRALELSSGLSGLNDEQVAVFKKYETILEKSETPASVPTPRRTKPSFLNLSGLLRKAFVEISGKDNESIFELNQSESPPLVHCQTSCVYGLITSTGQIYIGESDALDRRLGEHWRIPSRRYERLVYLPLLAGKGEARALESALIKHLVAAGIALESAHDGKRA